MSHLSTDSASESGPAACRSVTLTRADLIEAHRHAPAANLRKPRLRAGVASVRAVRRARLRRAGLGLLPIERGR